MSWEAASLTVHSADLLRYFRRRVPDCDAPDLLAETLTVAWRRVQLLPAEPVAARMWLFGIAHHVLDNHVRGERRRLRLADRLRDVLGTAPTAPASDTGIEIREAVEHLQPALRELIRLVHWDGFTLVEAADIMQIPASTARTRYQHAKQALRTALESHAATLSTPKP